MAKSGNNDADCMAAPTFRWRSMRATSGLAEHTSGGRQDVLGGLLAVCSAATFAFNNASVRRGVLSGSVGQAMAITVPLGVPLFFLAALATGHLGDVFGFPFRGLAALSLAGILHFVWGRYCNYR